MGKWVKNGWWTDEGGGAVLSVCLSPFSLSFQSHLCWFAGTLLTVLLHSQHCNRCWWMGWNNPLQSPSPAAAHHSLVASAIAAAAWLAATGSNNNGNFGWLFSGGGRLGGGDEWAQRQIRCHLCWRWWVKLGDRVGRGKGGQERRGRRWLFVHLCLLHYPFHLYKHTTHNHHPLLLSIPHTLLHLSPPSLPCPLPTFYKDIEIFWRVNKCPLYFLAPFISKGFCCRAIKYLKLQFAAMLAHFLPAQSEKKWKMMRDVLKKCEQNDEKKSGAWRKKSHQSHQSHFLPTIFN